MATVFISTVTSEFGSYRIKLRDSLEKAGHRVLIQENLGDSDTTLLEYIREKISEADVVICLVGDRAAFEPSNEECLKFGEGERFSYTQWEYIFARRLRKKIYVYYPDNAPVDEPNTESPEQTLFQSRFKANVIEASGIKRGTYSTVSQLIQRVLALQSKWPDSQVASQANIKPVALIVSARLNNKDPQLDDEVERVSDILDIAANEYRIVTIYGASLEEIQAAFRQYQNQIITLHFAGHNNSNSVALKSDPEAIDSVRELIKFLGIQKSLRFIFFNASLDQRTTAFAKKKLRGVNFISAPPAPDDRALENQAVAFYDQLTNEPVKAAYKRIVGDSGGWTMTGRGNFRLPDALNRITTRSLWTYAITLILISQISIAISYFVVNSPAWLAEYAYGIEIEDLESLSELQGTSDDFKLIPDSFETPDEATRRKLERVRNGSIHFGYLVEALRHVIAISILVVGLGFIYRRKLPREGVLFSSNWFRTRSTWLLFISAFAILGIMILYHTVAGPTSLADLEKADSKWAVLYEYEYPWRDADMKDATSFKDFVNAEGKFSNDDPLWKKLYLIPYVAYLPYSLVSYLGVGLPLLYLAILGLRTGWSQLTTFLNDVIRQVDQNNSYGMAFSLSEAYGRALDNAKEFLLITSLLSLAATYEACLGHLTLAFMAKIIVAVALLIIFLVFFAILVMFLHYSNAWCYAKRKAALLNDEEMERNLLRFRPRSMIFDPQVVISVLITSIAAVFFANYLSNLIS